MGQGSLGEAVLDLTADASDLKATMAEAQSTVMNVLSNLAGFAGSTTAAVIASVVALAAGAAVAMKIGLDATVAWGEKLDLIGDYFGTTDQQSATLATAMERMGVKVEEGAGAFGIFIKNLEASRLATTQAREAYNEMLSDIADSNRETLANLLDEWTTQQQDIAERRTDITTSLGERLREIEEGLSESIAREKEALTKRLAQMDAERTKQVRDFAKQEASIAKDAARDIARVNADEKKSLGALEKDTAKRLKNARSSEQRNEIIAEAEERKKEIQEAAKERRQEIAERKQERLTELRERKAEARAEFEEKKRLAKEESAERITQMEKQAAKQSEVAEKAAAKQEAALDKMLAKQEAAYNKSLEKQATAVEKAQEKARKALAKADTANPVAKALNKLGVEAFDAQGNVRDLFDLLPEIMDAFAKMPDGMGKSAIAMQLFGRSGGKFIDFLNQGRSGLEDSARLAEEFGLIVDSKAVEEYGRQWNVLGLGLNGVKIAIGNEVLPMVSELVEKMGAWARVHLPEIRKAIKNFFDDTKKFLGPLFGDIQKAFETGDWKPVIDRLKARFATMAKAAFDLIFGTLSTWVNDPENQAKIQSVVSSVTAIIMKTFGEQFAAIDWGKLFLETLPKMQQNVDGLLKGIDGIAASIVTGLLTGLYKAITGKEADAEISKSLHAFLTSVFTWIRKLTDPGAAFDVLNKMGDLGDQILAGLAKGLWDNAGKVRDALVGIINDGIDAVKRVLGIRSPSKVFADLGANMALGLQRGFATPQLNFAPTIASSINLARLPMASSSSSHVDNRRSESMINISHSDPLYIKRIVQEELERARWA